MQVAMHNLVALLKNKNLKILSSRAIVSADQDR
jgi:hypothetical protein